MVSFIHQTDLFHPHGDPDDHWDLATVYALAVQKRINLVGVLFDYPPPSPIGRSCDISCCAIGIFDGYYRGSLRDWCEPRNVSQE